MTKATTVIMNTGSKIKLANIVANGLDGTNQSVSKIIWSDGSVSWAKSWSVWNSKTNKRTIVRIGAGVYGNLTIYSV